LQGTELVFSGTILSITPDTNGVDLIVKFDIKDWFKGIRTDTIRTFKDAGVCGRIGREYVVFYRKFDGMNTTKFCDSDQKLKDEIMWELLPSFMREP
jgi:hypothetical protein